MTQRILALPATLALALAACSPPPPPPAAPPQVQPGTVTLAVEALPIAAMRALVGTYRGGSESIAIALDGTTLAANGAPLRLVGLDTFSGPAGAYLFDRDRLTIVAATGARRTLDRR